MSIANPADGLVAVTGASGFVGRHAVQHLSAAGLRLRLLARDPARLPPLPANAETITGSLQDEIAVNQLVHGTRAVVHLAGLVRGVTRDQFDLANARGAEVCAAAASAAGVSQFLLISSLAAREPLLSAYAASKRAGEDRVLRAAGDMTVTVLRPPAVYGPGDKEMLGIFRLMAAGVAPVFGSAAARFSLIYVEDLARAILAWALDETPPAGLFEVDDGTPDGYDWSDVCAAVSAITGRRIRRIRLPGPLLAVPAGINYIAGRLGLHDPMLTPGKLRELRHPDWVCRPGSTRHPSGWRPRFPLAEGLRRTPGWRP